MARNIYSQTGPLEALTSLGQGLQRGVGEVMQQIAEQRRQQNEIDILGQAVSKLGKLNTREDVMTTGMDMMQKISKLGVLSQRGMNTFLGIINNAAAVRPSKADIAEQKYLKKKRGLELQKTGLEVGIKAKEFGDIMSDKKDEKLQFLYKQALDQPDMWSPEIVKAAAEDAGLDENLVNTITSQANENIKVNASDQLLFGAIKYQDKYTESEVDNAIKQLKEKGLIPKDIKIPKIDRSAKPGTMKDIVNKAKQAALIKVLSEYITFGIPIDSKRMETILKLNSSNIREVLNIIEEEDNNPNVFPDPNAD